MKKINLLLLMVMATFSAMAQTVNFTLKVSNPAAVACYVNGVARELTAGDNAFSVQAYTNVSLKGVPPYYISGVTNSSGTPQSLYQGEWNFYPSEADEGGVFSVAVINIDEERDTPFTINVDDPSLVTARLSGFDQTLSLSPGENHLMFSYMSEQYLYLSSSTGKPLYEVKMNGENVVSSFGSYTIELAENCVIDITAKIPELPVTVSFSYSEDGFGALSGVMLDYVAVEDFDGRTLTATAGQQLTLSPNFGFAYESVKIDGETIGWTGTYNYDLLLTRDVNIEISAHPYGNVPFKVIVDDPSNIIFYRGYDYQNDILPLSPGENNLEISENNTTVSWKAADGCYITSVNINGEPLQYANYTNVTEGMTIEFVTGKIVLDKTAVVWIDNREAADTYFGMEAADRTRFGDLTSGYNIIPFYDGMNPFSVSWYSQSVQTVNKVYLDGTEVAPMYEGSTSYQVTIPDNGVVKIFLGEEPVECNVAFEADAEIDADVKKDIVTAVEQWCEGFTCFAGTQVTLSGEKLKVAVNDVAISLNEEGNYSFLVENPQTTVRITKDGAGITDVTNDIVEGDDAVYTLTGIRVGTSRTVGSLPSGIYILNGKKVIINR